MSEPRRAAALRTAWAGWLGVLAPALALVAVWCLATTLGPTSDVSVSDLYLYGVYADLVTHGSVPYLDFGFEYPPLGIVPIVAGRWLGGSTAHGYEIAFGALTLLATLVTQWCAGLIAGRRAAWFMVLLPLACGALVRTHIDAFPAALAFVGLVLVLRDRPTWGLAVLGLGTATKLVPGLIALVVLAWLLGRGQHRAALRGGIAFVLTTVVFFLPFVGPGLVDSARFHLDRPVQIESTPATVLWIVGGTYVTGTNIHPDAFKSNGLAGGSAEAVTSAFTVLLLVVLAWIVWLAWRRGRIGDPEDGPRVLLLASFAAVLAFVVLGKVFSPQYVVWLFPFAAVAWFLRTPDPAAPGGTGPADVLARVAAGLVVVACVLGQLWFPARYFELVASDGDVVALVALRNGVLLVALGALIATVAGPRRSTRPSAAART